MIDIRNISTGYRKSLVIDNLSLRLNQGDFCSILGPNGAGKSTLLKAIIGFQPLWEGEILFNDKNIELLNHKELAKLVAIIPQEIQLQYDYSVQDLVLMGRYPYLNYWQKYTVTDRQIVSKILKDLDLERFKDKNYSELSGGEKQRVNIGRALAQDSKAILLDESLVHLDINHQLEIIALLAEINRNQRKTVVIVSHNINLSSDYCNRLIILKEGKVLLDGIPEEVINKENIKEVYDADLEVTVNSLSKRPNILYPGWGFVKLSE